MIHFPRPFSKVDLFPFFSIAVSLSILASSLGSLAAASYSTFCKYEGVGLELLHD